MEGRARKFSSGERGLAKRRRRSKNPATHGEAASMTDGAAKPAGRRLPVCGGLKSGFRDTTKKDLETPMN